MRRLFFAAAFFTGLLFSSFAATADPYLGFGVGSSDITVDLTALGGGEFEDSSTATKLFAGYGFNQYIAAELAYYNFAEASVGGQETAPGSGQFVSASAEMSGFALSAVGSYPLGKHALIFARAGMMNWDADISLGTSKASNDGTDALLGLGAAYEISKGLLVQAEWETVQSDNPEVDVLSIGMTFRFR